MSARTGFSWSRVSAVFLKELVQMRRDRLTFAILFAMPLVQLLLFGYAINTDPRHMPAVVEALAVTLAAMAVVMEAMVQLHTAPVVQDRERPQGSSEKVPESFTQVEAEVALLTTLL